MLSDGSYSKPVDNTGTPQPPGRHVPINISERDPISGALRVRELHAFIPAPLPPTPPEATDPERFVGRLAPALVRAERGLARLEGALAQLPDPTIVLHALRRREAQRSSTIENTVASFEELALAEAGASGVRAEAREVLNNLDAIEHAVDSPLPMSLRLLRDAHAVLMRDVRNDRGGERARPGEFRTIQVFIGGAPGGISRARFIPPPPGPVLDECLRAYETWMHPDAPGAQPRTRYPDLIELAFNHYQFEAIHPFSDGNGRLGRLIVNVLPCKAGWMRFPVASISGYCERHRQDYYDALLGVSARGDWHNWCALFLRALAADAEENTALANTLLDLRAAAARRLATPTGSAAPAAAYNLTFRFPAVSATTAATELQVVPRTARRHLEALVTEHGLLEHLDKRVYGRLYVNRALLELLGRDFSSPPTDARGSANAPPPAS